MTTLVGTQTEFNEALKELIELDYNAIEAYEAAISRLENTLYKEKLTEFLHDHRQHVKILSDLLVKHGYEAPTGSGISQWLKKGKVVLANLIGDDTILSAMLSNEEDTNTAYQRMNERNDIWEDAKDILLRGVNDEKRHKLWLELPKE